MTRERQARGKGQGTWVPRRPQKYDARWEGTQGTWLSQRAWTHRAPRESTQDMSTMGTPPTRCIAGSPPGHGCHGDPSHRAHRGKAPGMRVSRGTGTHHAPWEGTRDTGVMGAPGTRSIVGSPPRDMGVVGSLSRHASRHAGRRERPRCWVRRRRWTPLAPGEGVEGGWWLSPKQDVPLGAGDALRQPFAELSPIASSPKGGGGRPGAGERRTKGGTRAPAPARRQGGRRGRDGVRGSHALR